MSVLSHLIPENNPRRGIIMMLLSGFFFAWTNVAIKHLGDGYDTMQISFFRCVFAILPAVGMVAATTGFKALKTRRWRHHVFRALTGTISMVSFFYSLKYMPLARAVAINYSAPLFVVLFSFLILKEPVKRLGWVALFIGFAGVITMVRPGTGHTNLIGMLCGVAGAVFFGFSMVGVRALGRTEAATTTVFYFTILSSLFITPFAIESWKTPDTSGFLILSASGIFAGIAQYFMTKAFQYAPATVISPFGYFAIFWAIVFGFLFWGEVPRASTFLGAGMVITAGLYTFLRETKTRIKFFRITEDPLPPAV